MLPGREIRDRVRAGFASGKLWRLVRDRAKLHGASEGGLACHVCDQRIPRGQVYAVSRGSAIVLVHLECYLFWLHACGLFEPEPVICAACHRLIPPHAETIAIEGESYHGRCWERAEASRGVSAAQWR